MYVKDLMQKRVFTVGPDDQVDRVFFLLNYEKIRHLPVMEKGRVIGIVSDRDLSKALGPRSRSQVAIHREDESVLKVNPKKVRHIMKRGVFTVAPGEHASRAAWIMASKKIGALPVVDKLKLVGIITGTDILMAFAKLDHNPDGDAALQAEAKPDSPVKHPRKGK